MGGELCRVTHDDLLNLYKTIVYAILSNDVITLIYSYLKSMYVQARKKLNQKRNIYDLNLSFPYNQDKILQVKCR